MTLVDQERGWTSASKASFVANGLLSVGLFRPLWFTLRGLQSRKLVTSKNLSRIVS